MQITFLSEDNMNKNLYNILLSLAFLSSSFTLGMETYGGNVDAEERENPNRIVIRKHEKDGSYVLHFLDIKEAEKQYSIGEFYSGENKPPFYKQIKERVKIFINVLKVNPKKPSDQEITSLFEKFNHLNVEVEMMLDRWLNFDRLSSMQTSENPDVFTNELGWYIEPIPERPDNHEASIYYRKFSWASLDRDGRFEKEIKYIAHVVGLGYFISDNIFTDDNYTEKIIYPSLAMILRHCPNLSPIKRTFEIPRFHVEKNTAILDPWSKTSRINYEKLKFKESYVSNNIDNGEDIPLLTQHNTIDVLFSNDSFEVAKGNELVIKAITPLIRHNLYIPQAYKWYNVQKYRPALDNASDNNSVVNLYDIKTHEIERVRLYYNYWKQIIQEKESVEKTIPASFRNSDSTVADPISDAFIMDIFKRYLANENISPIERLIIRKNVTARSNLNLFHKIGRESAVTILNMEQPGALLIRDSSNTSQNNDDEISYKSISYQSLAGVYHFRMVHVPSYGYGIKKDDSAVEFFPCFIDLVDDLRNQIERKTKNDLKYILPK